MRRPIQGLIETMNLGGRVPMAGAFNAVRAEDGPLWLPQAGRSGQRRRRVVDDEAIGSVRQHERDDQDRADSDRLLDSYPRLDEKESWSAGLDYGELRC